MGNIFSTKDKEFNQKYNTNIINKTSEVVVPEEVVLEKVVPEEVVPEEVVPEEVVLE